LPGLLAELTLLEPPEPSSGNVDSARDGLRVAIGVAFLRHPYLGARFPLRMPARLLIIHGRAKAGEFCLFVSVLALPLQARICAKSKIIRVGAGESGHADARAGPVLNERMRTGVWDRGGVEVDE